MILFVVPWIYGTVILFVERHALLMGEPIEKYGEIQRPHRHMGEIYRVST